MHGVSYVLRSWVELLRRATSFPSLSRDIFSKHIGDLLRPIREPRYVNDTAGQLAEKNQNRLVVEAKENLGALNADSTRLKQILLNLLSNACKFTKEYRSGSKNRQPLRTGERGRCDVLFLNYQGRRHVRGRPPTLRFRTIQVCPRVGS
jgi:signal transduction histidine kinase